jgi:hypothetical protein
VTKKEQKKNKNKNTRERNKKSDAHTCHHLKREMGKQQKNKKQKK